MARLAGEAMSRLDSACLMEFRELERFRLKAWTLEQPGPRLWGRANGYERKKAAKDDSKSLRLLLAAPALPPL